MLVNLFETVCSTIMVYSYAVDVAIFFTHSLLMRVCVTGGGGFIGSHLAKRLKTLGHYVIVADWKKNEYMEPNEFCDEFRCVDLRILQNCLDATCDCEEVYHLAADMGGMGFIQSNHGMILFNNTVMSCHIVEACRINKVRKLFYASSACIYPMYKQSNADIGSGLKESDAWPAQPEDSYGLEKLCTEELCLHYAKDFGLEVRIARFHNVYGPYGTWHGGREKAPAALCRKVFASHDTVEIWGDGEQTRSFMYIDDCIEGILKIMQSDISTPINLGSAELVSINQMAEIVKQIAGKTHLRLEHLEGPIGVRGRNSDNTMIKEKLGWEPSYPLHDGLMKTYDWVSKQMELQKEKGTDISVFKHSKVFELQCPAVVG